MPITLKPQIEAKLEKIAFREGRDVNALVNDLLVDLVKATERDFEEACAAITESLASDPQQDVSLEDYQAQFAADRETRRLRREAAQPQART